MPRLRSVDTIEYGFLLASIVAAGAAQFPSAGLAVQRVLDNVIVALGEPAATPSPALVPLPSGSPYAAEAPPNGKPAWAPPPEPADAPACPADLATLGPPTPRAWWRPLLPEFDARALVGRLDAHRESTVEKWR